MSNTTGNWIKKGIASVCTLGVRNKCSFCENTLEHGQRAVMVEARDGKRGPYCEFFCNDRCKEFKSDILDSQHEPGRELAAA